MQSVIEVVKRKMYGLVLYFEYFINRFYMSKWFQNGISRYRGISIADKLDRTLRIKYLFDGKEYEVYIPFERKLVSKMTNQTLKIYGSNSEPQTIRQQPGVPYFITPSHLRADYALLTSFSCPSLVKIDANEHLIPYLSK